MRSTTSTTATATTITTTPELTASNSGRWGTRLPSSTLGETAYADRRPGARQPCSGRAATYTRPVAYSEELAARIRDVVGARDGVTERRMFGGIAWMVNGNMACGTLGEDLMVRLDREDAERALRASRTSARWTSPGARCAPSSRFRPKGSRPTPSSAAGSTPGRRSPPRSRRTTPGRVSRRAREPVRARPSRCHGTPSRAPRAVRAARRARRRCGRGRSPSRPASAPRRGRPRGRRARTRARPARPDRRTRRTSSARCGRRGSGWAAGRCPAAPSPPGGRRR